MSYRITYGQPSRKRRHLLFWSASILAAFAALYLNDGWYAALARYVGAAIRGH